MDFLKNKSLKGLVFDYLVRPRGFVCFSLSPHALSLRRPPSLTQKIIQIFCLVLNAHRIQHESLAHFKSSLEKKEQALANLFFFMRPRGFVCFSLSPHALSLRKPPSLTQKIIQIFCLVLNAPRIQHESLAHFESSLEKKNRLWRTCSFLCVREDSNP